MIILLRGSKQLIDRDNNTSSTLFILLIIMTISTTYFFYKDWRQVDAIVLETSKHYGDPLAEAIKRTQSEYDDRDSLDNDDND